MPRGACRFESLTGHLAMREPCPLWANSGHVSGRDGFWPSAFAAVTLPCRTGGSTYLAELEDRRAACLRRSVLQPVASFGVNAIGKTNSKRDQFLPSDDAVSWPRCCSIIVRHMASPKPMPCDFVVKNAPN